MPFMIRPYHRFLPLIYCSSFGLLFTLLLLSSGPAYAEWVEVGGKVEEGLTIYLELDTISRSGDVVKMWELWDFKVTRTDPKPPHMSVKSHREIDCAKKRNRVLEMTAFSGNMGSGKAVYSASDFEDKEIQVEPGGVTERMWKVACGKQ